MRLWSKPERDSEEFDIPAPVGIEAILEYTMDGDAAVPEGVTVSGGEDISSRRHEVVRVKGEAGWESL